MSNYQIIFLLKLVNIEMKIRSLLTLKGTLNLHVVLSSFFLVYLVKIDVVKHLTIQKNQGTTLQFFKHLVVSFLFLPNHLKLNSLASNSNPNMVSTSSGIFGTFILSV